MTSSYGAIFPPLFDKTTYNDHLPLPECDDCVLVLAGNLDYSGIYRNKARPDTLMSTIHADLDTLPKLFNNAVEMFRDRPCLGSRPYNYQTKTHVSYYKSITYGEVNTRKRNLGSGILKSLELNPYKLEESEAHRKIENHLKDWKLYGVAGHTNLNYEVEKSCSFILSIFAANRAEWVLTDLACSAYAITSTALYDNLGPEVTRHILELTHSPVVVCSKDKVGLVIQFKKEFPQELGNIISIICMDPVEAMDPQLFVEAREADIVLQDVHQVEEIGRLHRLDELPPNKDSLYTISFTSGTTGARPKGAMVTQANGAAALTFLAACEPHAKENERAFVFLPLTHIYERETSGFALITGYYLGFPQLSVDGVGGSDAFTKMLEDLRIFKPTYFSIVPRLLTRLEAYIKLAIAKLPRPDQDRVKEIIDYKLLVQNEKDGVRGTHAQYDSFGPYKNLKELVGFENLLWTQTASAPISPSTLAYIKAAFGIGIRQLYGATETSGAITASGAHEMNPGSCGSIGVPCEVRLRQTAGMGHDLEKNYGEILIRGAAVFKGYYYNKKETEKALDNEGWYHTGDVTYIDPENGRIYIVDRVKNFFKMAQGEYVSPEKVENRYLSTNPMISQMFVYGNSFKPYLVGVVGISPEAGQKFLQQVYRYNETWSAEEVLQRLNEVPIKTRLLQLLNTNVNGKISRFEKLQNIHLETNPLTVERDIVTPTFKIKRILAAKFFGQHIHRMYEIENSLVDSAKL